ncbi:MAG: hypothetical protein LKI58_12040 [Actinomyces sp.]|jgi:hypothetical protein|nr:hypothetical protein [Actinomyces sp.]MCI1642784.1 hypothetical protein [Actinomyces sp.]MCI1663232.1 hypothetical protein [Actinomyces sp.]MCI1691995.1 hypothetical protein [Actinomyces sp.]MCI1788762.1 hypothetical protein [Actinomyces sp.]MCI1831137.1 hypothetical protein [Actinomyces sp.]
MNGYDADAIIAKFTDEPGTMLPLMALAMGFGFIQYVHCAIITHRDDVSPFPVYMHAYYLAHDFLFVLLFRQWFFEYDSIAFRVVWAGMVVFNLFEVYSLHQAVKHERRRFFGHWFGPDVTVRQAATAVVAMALVSFVFLNTARSFLDDKLMFCVFISTNVMMAIGPALYTFQRKDRVRGSVSLAFFIVLGTIATFLPTGFGMYTTGDPAYFSRPWFYLLGGTCLIVAVWHLSVVRRLPLRAPAHADEIGRG